MDFITGLPLDNGYNAVFVCIDKLTKLVCLVPCTAREGELSDAATARLFLHHIVRYFGVLNRLFMTMTLTLLVLCGMLCLKYLVASYFIVLLIIPKWMFKENK